MSFLPFNHQPTATVQDSSTAYTVPTNTYARAIVTLSVDARLSTGGSSRADAASISSNSDSAVIEIWLNEGDSISKSTTAASGTIASCNNSSNGGAQASVASVSVNTGSGATIVSQIRANVSGLISSGGTMTLTATGSSVVNWHIEEYAIPT